MAGKRIVDHGGGTDALPSAGDAQRDELKRRADVLAEAAETQLPELEQARPDAFKVENEIAQYFDLLTPTNADPNMQYCWVQFGAGSHGIHIKQKEVEGWRVVQGDDPESVELKGIGADTTRRIGDVLLMKISYDKYKLLRRRDDDKRKRMVESSTAGLRDLENQLRRRGLHVTIHEGASTMDGRTAEVWAKRQQAQQIAGNRFDQALRDGSVPGAGVRG